MTVSPELIVYNNSWNSGLNDMYPHTVRRNNEFIFSGNRLCYMCFLIQGCDSGNSILRKRIDIARTSTCTHHACPFKCVNLCAGVGLLLLLYLILLLVLQTRGIICVRVTAYTALTVTLLAHGVRVRHCIDHWPVQRDAIISLVRLVSSRTAAARHRVAGMRRLTVTNRIQRHMNW